MNIHKIYYKNFKLSFLLIFTLFVITSSAQNSKHLRTPIFENISEKQEVTTVNAPYISNVSVKNGMVRVEIEPLYKGNLYFKGLTKSNICKLELGGNRIDSFTISDLKHKDREPVAFALILDQSGSMGVGRIEELNLAVKGFLRRKHKDDYVVLLKFDHRVKVIGESKDVSELTACLELQGDISYGGQTALNDALLAGVQKLQNFDSTEYPNRIVIAFTDGMENSSILNGSSKIIQKARKNGVRIFTSDFGSEVETGYMESFADSTSGYYEHIFYQREMVPLFENFFAKINNKYILEFPVDSYGDKELLIDFCIPYQEIRVKQNVTITKSEPELITLNVRFDFDKSIIKIEGENEIKRFSDFLKKYPYLKAELSGHTDTVGTNKYNQALSIRRVQAVKNELINIHKINASRLTQKTFGETVIIDPINMHVDRRVDGIIVKE